MLPTGSGPGLAAAILADPDLFLFYRLSEAAGPVVHDEGPFILDITDTGSPAYAQPAGPPGELTVATSSGNYFARATGFGALAAAAMSVEMWVYRTSAGFHGFIGQGDPIGSNTGWALAGAASGGVAQLYAGNNVSSSSISGVTSLAQNTWYHVACTKSAANVWKLYVNGAQESGTITVANTTPVTLEFGTASANTFPLTGRVSYVAAFTRELSGAEILDHYTRAAIGPNDPAGKVWTTDGAGSASWEYPTIEVTY